MSSLGELIGAELYLIEIISPPKQYQIVALVACFAVLGGVAALGLASLITHFGLSWRIAFFIGTVIAITGTYARTRLRETRDFIDAKQQVKNSFSKAIMERYLKMILFGKKKLTGTLLYLIF